MILYTCGLKRRGGSMIHACARAINSLDKAGYSYEHRTVKGYRLVPWTRPSRSEDRAEIKAMSGTNEVPILVLDDGEVVSGSSHIARWAKEHPATR